MSELVMSGETRKQDGIETARGLPRCRIPQRLPSGRSRPPCPSNPRARDLISRTIPKTGNRLKEELCSNKQQSRVNRANERLPHVPNRPSPLIRRTNEAHKSFRPVIKVPMTQRPPVMGPKNPCYPMYQETLKTHADLELRSSEETTSPASNEVEEKSTQGELMQLKISWQDKVVQFEKMKNDLISQQKNILEVYAGMRDIRQKISSLGERVSNLPPPEDLRIMNVSKMTPEMLLQLCSGNADNFKRKHHWDGKTSLTIDIAKLYETPTKLIQTCEQALVKRKEVINWFESLKSMEKGISVQKLSKKINEFNGENDVLKRSLDEVKAEFIKELEEIVDLFRKGINETMALQLRTEELTYEVTELNSQNTDLKRKIQNTDHIRSHANKFRIEELEKELKDEKCKRIFMRDRLSRSDGLVKTSSERAAQLESTLIDARSQIWSLERTVQELHEQNQKLQSDFEEELTHLTESIKHHTTQLQEIANAREKLQAEKEDLEKRLTELSDYYNESLSNTKHEMNVNVSKLIETEKKYEDQVDNNKRLEGKLESLYTQLMDTEQRHKDTLQKLQEMEMELNKGVEAQKELVSTKCELEKANVEIDANRDQLSKQSEAIKEIERNFKETFAVAETLSRELSTKNEHIKKLEMEQVVLEQQVQENENKMGTYVDQLSALKKHINQLQEDFGEFENLDDLHKMVNQQRTKLLEATRQNEELTEALQEKDKKLEQYKEFLSEHEQLLLDRDGVVKMLSQKEEEQTNIIKLLRNNLELRSQAGNDLSHQIMEKNTEIDSLVVNLETRKQQISNMEKIILTLEDQTRKASLQRKKDKDHITMLQNKISEYESFHKDVPRNVDSPTENLDSLIKILEDELGTPMDPETNSKDHNYNKNTIFKNKGLGDRKHDKLESIEDNNSQPCFQTDHERFPTKIVMGNFIKDTYIRENGNQYTRDNLDRKKAKTNIDTQKWIPASPETIVNSPPTRAKKGSITNFRRFLASEEQNMLFKNLQHLNPDQQRDKKLKMFKLAGHRL